MQRELSSFDIYVIATELQELIGGYIDKIHQPTRDELLIRIKDRSRKTMIYVRNGELLCVTEKKFKVPKKPSTFAMTLRKYLLNGRISEITQHEFDRILKIKVSKGKKEYTLIFELFGTGNIILLNAEMRIILPLTRQHWAHRTLKPNEIYLPPPSQINPFNLTLQGFTELLRRAKKDLVRTLAVDMNLSGTYAEEICFRTHVDKNIKEPDEETIKEVYSNLQKFLKVFKDKAFQPVFVKKDGKITGILPIPFQSLKEYEQVETNRFSNGLQEFIDVKKKKEKSRYQEEIERLQRQLTQQREAIQKFKEEIKRKKHEGDVIFQNFQVCQELLDEIACLLKKKEKEEGIKRINEKDIVKNFDPVSNELTVLLKDNKGESIEVRLDFRKTVSENAENAYRMSKKFQEKLEGAQKALEETEKNLRKTVEEKVEEEVKEEKTFWFERYRWFISSEGNIVVAGRDAKSNEKVVKKHLETGDRYVHADIHGAPSCIVKNMDVKGKEKVISEETLREACVFAASYSKAWRQFSEAQVYWVLPEQVSKTPQSGEFIPKGAFVIRGRRNYRKCKLEIAVGMITIDDASKIMAGPLESVKSKTNKYVVLKPGAIKRNVVAQRLSKIFNVSTETIERVLPPGDMDVVETIGLGVDL